MKTRKAALAFIFITVALDMIALGIIIPVLPELILNFLGGSGGSPPRASRPRWLISPTWSAMAMTVEQPEMSAAGAVLAPADED